MTTEPSKGKSWGKGWSVFTMRMADSQWQWLMVTAKTKGESMASIVRRLIERGMVEQPIYEEVQNDGE